MPLLESMAANDETPGPDLAEGNEVGVNCEQSNRSSNHASTEQPKPTQGRAGSRNSTPNVPPLRRVRSFYTPYMEDKLLRRLKFFFMGPHEKIAAKRKCPWKLIIQVFKIILVTVQLIQFGHSRSSFVEFTEKSTTAMRHLYLKDWDNTYETMPYPPAVGKFAIYDTTQIAEYVDHAMEQYELTQQIAIGTLRFWEENTPNMTLCLEHYKSGNISNNTFQIDSTLVKDCRHVTHLDDGTFNITEYLKKVYNMTVDYDTLLMLELKFKMKLFRLEMQQRAFPPQLYRVDVTISLDDSNKDGQMLVKMKATLREMRINGTTNHDDAQTQEKAGFVVLDSVVLLFTTLSMLLCSRSVWRAQRLRHETNTFFKNRHGKSLSASDQCEFLNLWYVTIIINDILTIMGTGYKIQLEYKNLESSSNNYDYCSLMLGTGSLLAWLGVLRYIGYFQQFNILIVTLKKAFPNMMRFLACCIMLYMGFVICGWVVLGPYHVKFRQMSTASECLFSLINGDDMFVTFSATETDNQIVWYYSRVYLYLFISLFIYAVLNLFIAVIMDTYETIKEYYEHGFPKSELFVFIDQCQDTTHSPMYRREDDSCSGIRSICCCCSSNPDHPNEYTSLIQ